ncbi:hypothetical protein ACQJBY_025118 [Aegilops geniculata]
MVFDTTAERFRKMCGPVVHDHHKLFEMDGMLGMSGFNDTGPIIDIWMMQEQDYESEVWTLKYRVELSNADHLLCSLVSLSIIGMWWSPLVMALCLCWSSLASLYFSLILMASWSVSITKTS